MNVPKRLPIFLPINDARRDKEKLFASLSGFDVELLDRLASGRFTVFGGDGENIVITKKSRAARYSVRAREEDESRIVLPRGEEARALERAGWLRYSPGPLRREDGFYHLTESAEKIWGALGR